MRRSLRLLPAALALVALAGVLRFGRHEAPFAAGQAAPPMRFTDADGGETSLAALRGRVVVLNFWATWCAPCLAELPSLDRLHRALSPEGLSVIAVSVDAPGLDPVAFARGRGLVLPVWRDPGGAEAGRALGVDGYPTTFVVDAFGRLEARYLGVAEWDRPEALDHFRERLRARTAPTR